MAPVRVAQLSFWFIHALQFCHAAQQDPDVELVGVWDSDEERGRRQATALGVPFYADLEELLSRPDLDAVSLCAEPFRQPGLVEAAAAAGKHVLIEKPMASDLDGAARIVRAVESAGVIGMPAYNLRYHPVALYIKDLVDSGRLGRIARVRRLHGHSYAYERGDFDGRRISENMGWQDPVAEHRDSLFFAGSHAALWFQWMFGSPTAVLAAATTVTESMPVEDNAVALLQYPEGMVATMETSETMLAQGTVTEIYGTEGVVLQLRGNLPSTRVWSEAMSPLMVFDRGRNEWELPALPPEFLRHEPQFGSTGEFLRCVREGTPPSTDVYDGYDSIAILVAAEDATRTGRRTPVDKWVAGGAASSPADGEEAR
jgi:1,5-anhydro-D-fructose reductase (1,5-anhydro-D-mannitol-forming)